MADSTRMLGMVLVAIGSVIQVVTLRLGIGTAVGVLPGIGPATAVALPFASAQPVQATPWDGIAQLIDRKSVV